MCNTVTFSVWESVHVKYIQVKSQFICHPRPTNGSDISMSTSVRWSWGGRGSSHKAAPSILVILSLSEILESWILQLQEWVTLVVWVPEGVNEMCLELWECWCILLFKMSKCLKCFAAVLCCLKLFLKVLPPAQPPPYRSLTCRYGYCHSRGATAPLLYLFCELKVNVIQSWAAEQQLTHIRNKQLLLFWWMEVFLHCQWRHIQ